jgi:heat shock protein HslJ
MSVIDDLGGSAWTVRTINGGAVIANAPPTMTFSTDGRITGSTGCNEFSALFSTVGERLTVGGLGVTQKLCEGAHGEQEQAFLNGLGGAASWHVPVAGQLEIDGAATLIADTGVVPSKAPPTPGAALSGTSWDLTEMGGTGDFAHLVPTIDFGADGSVAGFAGCNTFSGTFDAGATSLRLGPLATTKIACQRPASEIESTYLAALAGVSTWSIGAEGVLLLGGGVPMRFAAR